MSNLHTLTSKEKELSKDAAKQLDVPCAMYQDGSWICDPHKKGMKLGYGSTPEEAVADCAKGNNIILSKQK